MTKLKSLRAAIGSYGRVAAGGIIEVDDAQAKKLRATKRFVDATAADIEAAQKRQAAALTVQVKGAAPGFTPIAEGAPGRDRVQDMIERGAMTPEDARRLAALQIELSPAEIQTMIKGDADRAMSEIEAARTALDAREAAVADREAALEPREADLVEREQALAEAAKDLDAREAALQDVPPAIEDADAAEPAPAGDDTGASKPKARK